VWKRTGTGIAVAHSWSENFRSSDGPSCWPIEHNYRRLGATPLPTVETEIGPKNSISVAQPLLESAPLNSALTFKRRVTTIRRGI
jgi:hypothetical protein